MSELQPSPEFEEKVRKAMDVPNANPEFVNKLHNELVRGPVEMKSRFLFKPAWAVAFVLALAVMLVSVPGVAAAIGRLIGYVPEVGLVENTGDLRILDHSYSMTREGVTLTINYVLVDKDHVEVIYDVQGISAENDSYQAADAATSPKAFCGGVSVGDTYNKEGDPILKLPDGTLLERDLTGKYPQNMFAMKPVYDAQVPADVLEMTFTLKCIPNARLGAVPENWEIPFKLKAVPADTVFGSPVIEVAQPTVIPTLETSAGVRTEQSAAAAPIVKLTLEKVVPMESATILYISLDMENKDPALISLMPSNVYAIDSHGEKVWLIGNYMWQPFEHLVGTAFEFTTQSKPADGPLTVVVENAVAVYAPLYTDPPQATPEEMTFTFDAGENPQYGQTWEVNNEFTIAGYPLKVTSIRAADFKDIEQLNFPLGSQGFEYGYDFTIEADPSVKLQPLMDILSDSPVCYLSNGDMTQPKSSPLHYIQLCKDTYPKGIVKVNIWQLSVLFENTWQVTWTP